MKDRSLRIKVGVTKVSAEASTTSRSSFHALRSGSEARQPSPDPSHLPSLIRLSLPIEFGKATECFGNCWVRDSTPEDP